jgi:hypothetical protein
MTDRIYKTEQVIDSTRIISEEHVNLIYCNGDSWSWGSELGDESESYRNTNNFAGLLAKKFNVPLTNVSMPGASNDRIFRTTVTDILKLKEQNKKPLVVIAWTEIHRFELFNIKENKWVHFNNPDKSPDKALSDKIWGSFSNDRSDVEKFITHIVAIESFFKSNNIPYIMTNIGFVPFNLLDPEMFMLYKPILDSGNYVYLMNLYGLLKSNINVKWMPNQHPDEHGHKVVADFLEL